MEPFGATALHELMHFNTIGKEAGLTKVSSFHCIPKSSPSSRDHDNFTTERQKRLSYL
jgi:hypothetical protein